MSVSAVVVSHGHARDLETLVPALARQVDDLVVVANMPGSAPSGLPPRVRLLENARPLRLAENINLGIAATAGAKNADALKAVRASLDELAVRHGLKPGDLVCTRLDRSARATIEFGVELPAHQKALLMMALERDLKEALEGTIHLYQEEMRDRNKIRRL